MRDGNARRKAKLARNMGAASLYGLRPSTSDQSTAIKNYFTALANAGIRTADFDIGGSYVVGSNITGAENVIKKGPVKFNKAVLNNWLLNCSKGTALFNGKINTAGLLRQADNTIRPIFKQMAVALNANRTVKIGLIGTSITVDNTSASQQLDAGLRLTDAYLGVSSTANAITSEETYVNRLIESLVQTFPQTTYSLYDYGIAGTTISQWDSQQTFSSTTKAWIDFLKDAAPDLVFIEFGMNESTIDSSRTFAYDMYAMITYIRANFNPVPDIVVMTVPRPYLNFGLDAWGTFDGQMGRFNAANVARAIGREYGCYVCDVARISDIKRIGLDFTKPIIKQASLTDFTLTPSLGGVNNGNGTYTLPAGGKLDITGNPLKDFTLQLQLAFSVNTVGNENALTIDFNKQTTAWNTNQVVVNPKVTTAGALYSYMRIANYTDWGTYLTGTWNDSRDYSTQDMYLQISKRGPVITYGMGIAYAVRALRDYADTFDVPGTIQLAMASGGSGLQSVLIKNITMFTPEYPEYIPTLLDSEVFGSHINGDYNTRTPYGGNGANHPSSIMLEDCYAPALRELVEDIARAVGM